MQTVGHNGEKYEEEEDTGNETFGYIQATINVCDTTKLSKT